MNKMKVLKSLYNGISELIQKDGTSIMATIAPQHLPSIINIPINLTKDNISVFNVNTEKWENYRVDSFVSVEQLTGEGADSNKSKLQSSPEYLEQLSLFSSNDLDTMEHPEDL